MQLYLNQKIHGADRDPGPGGIYVTNREMTFITGTALVTLFVNLNAAVLGFSLLFYVLNRWVFAKNPLRDLKAVVESEGIGFED